jgi:hypothetical protein
MPLPLLSMRSSKKSKMGKKTNRGGASPAAAQEQRPKPRVLKLEKRNKSSSPIETHLASPFQFQLLEDHEDERHSLDSASQSPHSLLHHLHAEPLPPPPKESPHNSKSKHQHSLPILEVWMDPNDCPPSPMQDDDYSVVRNRNPVQCLSEPALQVQTTSASKQVDQYQTQLWDAQRLVRVILGKKTKTNADDDEPLLESGTILQAIRTYAGVKQQVQQLQQEKLEQAAVLEASQQSQYYDRSGIVLAAKKIQSLEQQLSDAKGRISIQELEILEATSTTSKQKEVTPETSPTSSLESSTTSTMMFQRTTNNNTNNEPNEETTSTSTAPESPSSVSLEQVLEMQTKHQETLEMCHEQVQQIFLQLAIMRGGNNADNDKEKESKQELSQQQAKEIRDQLQLSIHTIARQQSQQEIQDLQVQLVQQQQSHQEQLLQALQQQQQQQLATSEDVSPEFESVCTPSKNKTSTSTSSTPPTQSDLELILYKLNSVPADQVPTPEKHKIRSHVLQLLQRMMTESTHTQDLVRLTQELQASQTTVEALTSQLERHQQEHQTEWETYLQQMTKEKEQVQVQWSQLQQDLETAKDSLQSQSQNAQTREARLQQTIVMMESHIDESFSVSQYEGSLADPMASQRELNLADQSFDDATKELALSQNRIQKLQTLLGDAREEIESCQNIIEAYQEDNARETLLTQGLQLQIGSLQAQIDTTGTTTLQNKNVNQSTHSTEYQATSAQLVELLQKHEQMQDAQVQLESSVVQV